LFYPDVSRSKEGQIMFFVFPFYYTFAELKAGDIAAGRQAGLSWHM